MRRNLTKARKDLHLTQKRLGEMVGLGKSTICQLENGKISGSVKTWERLEAVLGVDDKILRQIADTPQ